MQFNWQKIIVVMSSFLLVLLFIYTGMSKLLELPDFRDQLYQIYFLKPFVPFVSVALPLLEIITGTAIVYKPTMQWGLWSAAILMTLFSLYVALMLAGDPTKLPCSCGGVISAMSWKMHLYLNILFMLLAWLSIKLTGIRKRE